MVTVTHRCPHSDIQVPPWSLMDNGSDTGMSPKGDGIQVPLWPIGDNDDAGMSPNGDSDTEMPPLVTMTVTQRQWQ